MVLLGLIALVAGVWLPVSNLCERLPNSQAADLRKWLRVWAIKGLAAPVLIWIFFNLGVSEYFPPLMGDIQAAARGWATIEAFLDVAGDGFCIIGSYWAAFTLGWLLRVLEEQMPDQREFKAVVLGLSALLVPLAVLLIYWIGTRAAGVAGVIWLAPVVQLVIPLAFRPRTAPSYHRAVVKMHGDKYKEAETAVIEELEKSENDFRGWLMLAQLYAHHFDDLAGADRIIRDTCGQAATTASEFCEGLNALADWHLQLARDPVAARNALGEICRRYPETHMGRMAQRRIAQLPASREDYVAQLQPKTIRLPALGKSLETEPVRLPDAVERKAAAALANECVLKLQNNPDNMAARKELARIFAEQLGNAAAGIEQLELLLNMPSATAAQAAEWLGLTAAWHVKYLNDLAAGRETMERLVRRYPESAAALAAARRMNLMDLEAKVRAARANAPVEPKLSILSRA